MLITETAQVVNNPFISHSLPQYDFCRRKLAVTGMGLPEHQRLQNLRMQVQHRFHLLGKDLHPGKNNHVLLSADDEEKSVRIDLPQVAGVKPSVLKNLSSPLPG